MVSVYSDAAEARAQRQAYIGILQRCRELEVEALEAHASDFHQLLTRLPAELFAPVVIDDQPASHKRLIGQGR